MTAPAPATLSIDVAHSAMVSLDLQAGIVSVYVKDESFVPRAARTLHAARLAGLPVVHVKVGFRPLVPEANPRNMFLSAIKASPPHQQFFQGASGAIHPDLGVDERDLLVTKDYRLIVVSDCCADLDPDLHDTLVDKVLPRQALVFSADHFARAIGLVADC